jgi:predicted small secreted protein
MSTLVLLTLVACETAEGFGRDVQKAGQAIESEAE